MHPLVLIARSGLEEDPERGDFLSRYAVEHFRRAVRSDMGARRGNAAETSATGTGAKMCREGDQPGSKTDVGALAKK
jgi:hypothetical protein